MVTESTETSTRHRLLDPPGILVLDEAREATIAPASSGQVRVAAAWTASYGPEWCP